MTKRILAASNTVNDTLETFANLMIGKTKLVADTEPVQQKLKMEDQDSSADENLQESETEEKDKEENVQGAESEEAKDEDYQEADSEDIQEDQTVEMADDEIEIEDQDKITGAKVAEDEETGDCEEIKELEDINPRIEEVQVTKPKKRKF